jgi:hypothetical protein
MSDILDPDKVTEAFNAAVKQSIEEKQRLGLPIAKWDTESQRAYLEYPDGSREYV